MTQPDELKSDSILKWSTGRGTDVWAMFQAVIAGDLEGVKRLARQDPSLVRCHFEYRTPLYFAVRENRVEIARFFLEQGDDPLRLAVNSRFIDIALDRGYVEMRKLLEGFFNRVKVSPEGNAIGAAIRDRDPKRALALIDAAPGLVHAADERSNQPIHWATMTRQIDLIDELVKRGADIDARRMDHARPIHLSNGDYFYRGWRDVPKDVKTTPAEVLKHLIDRGAYVDIWTASHLGDLDRVRELLDADPSLARKISDHPGYYLGSGDALKNAAARGHIEIVKLLLARGADPNLREDDIAPNGHGLYSAVYNGHYEIAKLLLEHHAYPNPEVESSADALSIAILRGDTRMVELLCSYGAASNVGLLAHYGDTKTAAAVFAANPALADDPGALASAAGNGHEGFVRLMLRCQPEVARRVRAAGKTRELTELLFQHGMDPNAADWLEITMLHQFAGKGDVENAALFIEHGADLHARDEDICSTPLAWAAKAGKIEMVRFLLDRGAMSSAPDDPAWATPLAWAVRRGHKEIAEVLRERGARS